MADENISIGVDLKDNLSAKARRVIKSIDDILDSAETSRPALDILEGGIEGVGDESLKTSVKARTASRRIREMGNEALKTAGKMKVLSSTLSRIDRLNVAGGGNKKDSTAKYIKAGFQFRGLRIAMIVAAIASVIPAVVSGISALGAAVMGLAGALGPLTGLVVAYPGYLAAFGQAFATIKLGFSGLGEAIKTAMDPTATAQELKAAYSEFGTSLGRQFTSQFVRNISVARREIDGMKGAIQQALLPAVNNLVSSARNLFPVISTGLASTGAALASVTNKFAAMINTTEFARQLNTIMGSNVQIIGNFGDAAVSGLRTLMDVLVAAGPMLTKISADISSMFQTLSGNIGASSASGGLSAFFEQTYQVAKQVLQIFWDIGVALKNIATLGAPLGRDILNSFSKIAEGFRSFTESESGRAQIAQWFTDMKPVIYELGFFVRDLAKAFMSLSHPKELLLISQTLRLEMLPVIVRMIESFSNLLPAFLSIAVGILKIVAAIMEMAPLEGTIKAIGAVFVGLGNAVEAFASGPLASIGTGILSIFTMVGALGFIGKFFAMFGGVFTWLIRNIITVGGTMNKAAGAALTFRSALALLGGPIGWVLAAIAALIAILNAMWNVSQKFRDGVTSAFNMVKSAIEEAVSSIQGKLQENADAVNFLQNAFKFLADIIGQYIIPIYGAYLSGIIKGISLLIGLQIDYWNMLISVIKTVITAFLEFGSAAWAAFGSFVDKFLIGLELVIRGIAETFGWLPMGIGDALVAAADKVSEFRKGATNNINALSDGLGGAARAVSTWSMYAADGTDELTESIDELALATQAATNYLQRLNGWLDTLGSNASWRQSFMDLKSALEEGTSFKRFTEEGEKNLAALRGAVEQSLEKVQTLYEGGNVKGAERVLQKRIQMLKGIMLELPEEDRKPFQKMIDRLQTQRRRFDRQIQAMMSNPTSVEVPVDMKIKADIRTPSTKDIPQSVLQGLPDISTTTTVERKINVDSTQVDAAQTKTNNLKTTLDTVESTSYNISISYNSLSMAVVKAQTLKSELIALTSKPWIVNVEYKETGKRANGGPITAGLSYTVGERGPEAFIGESGKMTMIGTYGQQQRTFNEDGWVIPNHQLASVTAGMASETPVREYMSTATTPTVNIGTINASSEIDVIKAVKKGIAEAERNRRERS